LTQGAEKLDPTKGGLYDSTAADIEETFSDGPQKKSTSLPDKENKSRANPIEIT
jgi:hypothetical protein